MATLLTIKVFTNVCTVVFTIAKHAISHSPKRGFLYAGLKNNLREQPEIIICG